MIRTPLVLKLPRIESPNTELAVMNLIHETRLELCTIQGARAGGPRTLRLQQRNEENVSRGQGS